MNRWSIIIAQKKMKEHYPDKSMIVKFPFKLRYLFKGFRFDCTEMYRAGFMNGYVAAEEKHIKLISNKHEN